MKIIINIIILYIIVMILIPGKEPPPKKVKVYEVTTHHPEIKIERVFYTRESAQKYIDDYKESHEYYLDVEEVE